MKFCEKCNVSVTGRRNDCPLCQHSLSGNTDGSESMLPYVPSIQRQFKLMFKLAIFIAIVSAILCVAVNLAIPQSGWWSLIVIGGILCLFISVSFAVNKWSNPAKNIIYQVVIISGSCVLWDVFTGWHGWSIDFVVPISCVSAMVTMAVISRILKLEIQDSMLYWILGILFGLIPIIFVATNAINIIFPSLICISISLILLAAFIIFDGKRVMLELRRRFHL